MHLPNHENLLKYFIIFDLSSLLPVIKVNSNMNDEFNINFSSYIVKISIVFNLKARFHYERGKEHSFSLLLIFD